MHELEFEAAKKLIKERRYQEARALLKTIQHPRAEEWLKKLDKLSPETSESADSGFLRLKDGTVLEIVDAPDKLKRKPRKRPPLYIDHRLKTILTVVIIVLFALALGFGAAVLLLRREPAPLPTALVSTAVSTPLPVPATSAPDSDSPSDVQSLLLANSAQKALDNNDTDLAIRLALEANQAANPRIPVQRALFAAAYTPGTLAVLKRPNAMIKALAPSPDGAWLAVAYWTEDPLWLWDISKRALIRHFDTKGIEGLLDFQMITFSPDSRYLVAAGRSTNEKDTITPLLVMWNTATGQRIRTFTGHTSTVTAVTFSPDGRFILSGAGQVNDLKDFSIRLWNVETGEQVRQYIGHTASIVSVKFKADSNEFLSAGDDNSAILWDTTTGKLLHRYSLPEDSVLSADLFAFKSGEMFALVGGLARAMHVVDLNTGSGIDQYAKHTDIINSLRFSPDAHYAASGSDDHSISLVDLVRQKEVAHYQGDSGPVMAIAFSPDGKVLFSGDTNGDIRLWSVDSRAQLEWQYYGLGIRSLALSPDQKTFLIGYQSGEFSLKDATTTTTIRRFKAGEEAVVRVVFSPDGKWAVSSTDYPEHKVTLWDIETGEEIRQLKDETVNIAPKGLAFRPDSRMIAADSAEGKPYLLNIETGEKQPLEIQLKSFPEEGEKYTYVLGPSVVFNADGSRLLASVWPDTIVVWDAATGKLLSELTRSDAQTVESLAFSPDARSVLAGYLDGTIILWNLDTGQEIRRFKGHNGSIADMVFTPNGKFIISSSESTSDNLILWDSASGEEIYRFPNQYSWVNDLALATDGVSLYTASSDGSLQVWYIPQSLSDLKAWVTQNRYVRELTCEERIEYQIKPLC